jgi:hypothetical protein
MADGMLLMAVFLSACAGFACLALSQRRHWAQVLSGEPPRPTVFVLRTLGSALLLLSLIIALLRDGPSFGSLLWATAISVAALAVAFTLAWRPAVLCPLAVAIRWMVAPCMTGVKMSKRHSIYKYRNNDQ